MTPNEVTKLLRDKGLCGRVSGDKPHEVACVLAIGHDGGEHEDPERWETGIRNIVGILLGNRVTFDVSDVVDMVRDLHGVLLAARKLGTTPDSPDDRASQIISLYNAVDSFDCTERRIIEDHTRRKSGG